MPPLEMQLIVAPSFGGQDLGICELIMSNIAIGLMNPQDYAFGDFRPR